MQSSSSSCAVSLKFSASGDSSSEKTAIALSSRRISSELNSVLVSGIKLSLDALQLLLVCYILLLVRLVVKPVEGHCFPSLETRKHVVHKRAKVTIALIRRPMFLDVSNA